MTCGVCRYDYCWVCGMSFNHWTHKLQRINIFGCKLAPKLWYEWILFLLMFLATFIIIPLAGIFGPPAFLVRIYDAKVTSYGMHLGSTNFCISDTYSHPNHLLGTSRRLSHYCFTYSSSLLVSCVYVLQNDLLVVQIEKKLKKLKVISS